MTHSMLRPSPQAYETEYVTFDSALNLPPDRLRASDLDVILMPDHYERLRFSVSPLQVYIYIHVCVYIYTQIRLGVNPRNREVKG